jgi:hypothetical protein
VTCADVQRVGRPLTWAEAQRVGRPLTSEEAQRVGRPETADARPGARDSGSREADPSVGRPGTAEGRPGAPPPSHHAAEPPVGRFADPADRLGRVIAPCRARQQHSAQLVVKALFRAESAGPQLGLQTLKISGAHPLKLTGRQVLASLL